MLPFILYLACMAYQMCIKMLIWFQFHVLFGYGILCPKGMLDQVQSNHGDKSTNYN